MERPDVGLLDEGEIQTVRGQQSSHVIRLAGDHSVEALSVDLPEGFKLVRLDKREDGDFDLTVEAAEDATERTTVGVFLGDTEGPKLGELTIVSTSVEVESYARATKSPSATCSSSVSGVTWSFMNADHGLFDVEVGHREFSGPVGGAAPSASATSPFAGPAYRAGLASWEPGRGGDSRGTHWSLRGQVVGQLPFRVTPTAQIGFDLFGIRSDADFVGNDTDYGFHWGVGGKAFLTRRVALNLGLNHLVYEAVGSGQTSHLEIYGGVRVVFGRVSAGRKGK